MTGCSALPATVPALLARAAAARPQGIAHAVDGGGALTFESWERRSDDAARGLVTHGVRAGDRVALVFDRARWLDLAVAYLGVQKAGGVAVPLGRQASGLDLDRILEHCRPVGTVGPLDLAVGRGQGWVAEVTELERQRGAGPLPSAPGAGHAAEIRYGSSAMRLPEAHSRSHGELVSSALAAPVVPGALVHALAIGSSSGTDALLGPLGKGHGPTVALPRFDLERFCALAAQRDVRSAALPSSVARMLLGSAPRRCDLSSLSRLLVHGDAPEPVRAGLAAAFPHLAVTYVPTRSSVAGGHAGVSDSAPVPPFLQGMVWHEQFAPGSFNLSPLVRRLQGRLDVTALEAALHEIVRRHESLRTTFTIADGLPVQLVWSPRPVRMPQLDLRLRSPQERAAELARIIADARSRAMDLVQGPLFQPTLVRLGTDDHVLVVRVHISIYDDFSVGPFRRELSALYAAFLAGRPSPLPEVPLQFADLCRAQRQSLEGPGGQAQRSYWARELAGAPLAVQLPVDDPDRQAGTPHPATEPLTLEIGLEVAGALRSLARHERSTLFMVALAAFGVLVHRYTGQDDVLVSTLVGNRGRTELEGMIACLSRKVLVRLRLADDPSFPELVGRARAAVVGALANADLSYETVVQGVLGMDAGVHGLTPEVGVKFQAAVVSADKLQLPGLTVGAPPSAPTAVQRHFRSGQESAGAQSPAPPWGAGLYLRTFLGLYLSEVGGPMRLVTEGAFHPPAVARLLDHFHTLLADIAGDPSRRVSELSLLDDEGRAELLERFNGNRAEIRSCRGLHHAVAAEAGREPDRVAIVIGERSVTYGHLDEQANGLAARLRTAGVAPGALVGLFLEPGADIVVAVLGIWKAGAAYVALDPDDDDEHVAFVLADTGIHTVVAAPAEARLRCGNRQLAVIDPTPRDDREGLRLPAGPAADANGLACVFYGSGGTAVEHGVELGHASLASMWAGLAHLVQASAAPVDAPALRICLSGVATSDGFLRQLGGLADGHCLRLLPCLLSDDPTGVVALVRNGAVDVVEATPDELRRLLASGLEEALAARPGDAPRPRVVLASRDRLDVELWQAWRRLPAADVHHVFGPPACSFAATVCRAEEAPARPSIGRPLPNVRSYVLDRRGEPVPIGVAGELHLAGDNVARGYRGHRRLTEERFSADPFAGGGDSRSHATGQLARSLPDGSVELLGAVAGLVDLRGFLVEPARIEASLAGCPGVRRVEIRVIHSGSYDQRLVARVVPEEPSRPPTLEELRCFLWTELPGYAWPAELVVVDGRHSGNAASTSAAGRSSPGARAGDALGDERLLASAWADARGGDDARAEDNYWQSFSFLDALADARESGLAASAEQVARNRTVQALAADVTSERRRAGRGSAADGDIAEMGRQ